MTAVQQGRVERPSASYVVSGFRPLLRARPCTVARAARAKRRMRRNPNGLKRLLGVRRRCIATEYEDSLSVVSGYVREVHAEAALHAPHIVFALDAVGQNVSGLERETSRPGKEGHYMDHSFVRAQRKKRARQKTKMSYGNV